jgi:hypothetical protein
MRLMPMFGSVPSHVPLVVPLVGIAFGFFFWFRGLRPMLRDPRRALRKAAERRARIMNRDADEEFERLWGLRWLFPAIFAAYCLVMVAFLAAAI